MTIKTAHRRRLAQAMRKRGWNRTPHRDGLRARAYSLCVQHTPWWNWGHRVMILTGSDMGGTWQEPKPPTWWYRLGPPTRMRRTGYPRHPLSTFEVITDYRTFSERTKGLNEDEMYEWNAIYVDQDGALSLGHRFWGGTFYSLKKCEVALLRRYLRMWHRHDWWGARSWLYAVALHAAVHQKKPFACHDVPPKGSGGYSHWHCTEKRGHDGLHRFRNCTWGEIGGEPLGVVFHPRPTEGAA